MTKFQQQKYVCKSANFFRNVIMPHHLNNAKMFSNVLSITIDPHYTTKMCIVKISHKTYA
jgi:hypothetical protein